MKKILFIVLILFVTYSAYAQLNKSSYLMGGFGGFSGGGEATEPGPRNAPSIVLSTGFGMPLFDKVFLYTRASFISKSNYIAHEYNGIPGSNIGTTSELITADASFSQLILNGGLQYNFYLNKYLTLGVSGGVTYALVNYKASLPNGALLERLDNEGVFGAFTGLNLEKTFKNSNVSLFGEAQYNYAKKDVVYFKDKFSGMNFTIGGRYYFNNWN